MTQTADHKPERLMDYFPVQMKVSGRKIIFCGGQEDVLAKVRLLAKTSAELVIIAPEFCDGLLRLADHPRLHLLRRSPQKADFADAVLCYVSAENTAEMHQAKALATAWQVPVFVIDNKPECDFLTPAIIDHAPVTVAIGSEGYTPLLVRKLKALFEEQIPAQTGRLAEYASALRPIARLVPAGYKRRAFWSKIFNETGPTVLKTAPVPDVRSHLSSAAFKLAHNLITEADQAPHVDFISAGPGGTGLMTQQAVCRLRDADIVLHDRLISSDCLELCRREAEVIEVGKTGYAKHQSANWTQQDIDHLLVSSALTGKRVVRLKAGDAGLFGRLRAVGLLLPHQFRHLLQTGFDEYLASEKTVIRFPEPLWKEQLAAASFSYQNRLSDSRSALDQEEPAIGEDERRYSRIQGRHDRGFGR